MKDQHTDRQKDRQTLSISEQFQSSSRSCVCVCVHGSEVMKTKDGENDTINSFFPRFSQSFVLLGQLMCRSLSPDVVIHDPARN